MPDHGRWLLPSLGRVRSDWYEGAADESAARREQAEAVAPMVIYVHTDWCGYCRQFEKQLLSDSTVDHYLRANVVKLRFNPESGSDEEQLARSLGVTGYPTVFLVMPGEPPQRLSIYRAEGELRSPTNFVAQIEDRRVALAPQLLARGAAQRSIGQAEAAFDTLTMALRLDPESVAGHRERARALQAMGDVRGALDDLARVARTHPADTDILVDVERLLSAEGREEEAIDCWSRLLGVEPSSAVALAARGRLLRRAGRPALAAQDATRACELGDASSCASAGESTPAAWRAG